QPSVSPRPLPQRGPEGVDPRAGPVPARRFEFLQPLRHEPPGILFADRRRFGDTSKKSERGLLTPRSQRVQVWVRAAALPHGPPPGPRERCIAAIKTTQTAGRPPAVRELTDSAYAFRTRSRGCDAGGGVRSGSRARR